MREWHTGIVIRSGVFSRAIALLEVFSSGNLQTSGKKKRLEQHLCKGASETAKMSVGSVVLNLFLAVRKGETCDDDDDAERLQRRMRRYYKV